MPNQVLHIFPDLDALSHLTAERLIVFAQDSINSQRHFSLCLSGGNTPRRLYQLLATEYRTELDWNNIHLFWGDERWVPPTHPESNYAMVYRELISQVPIPASNIHRIPAEINPPEQAARIYEQELKKYLFNQGINISQGSFDLVLLGLGVDGHTASLFPNNPVLDGQNQWVAAVVAPDYMQLRQRITLTLPILNQANHIFFLVSGEEKKPILHFILSNPEEASGIYPAARIQSKNLVEWFVDKPAYL
jgi:6-phosphogluconolactonase